MWKWPDPPPSVKFHTFFFRVRPSLTPITFVSWNCHFCVLNLSSSYFFTFLTMILLPCNFCFLFSRWHKLFPVPLHIRSYNSLQLLFVSYPCSLLHYIVLTCAFLLLNETLLFLIIFSYFLSFIAKLLLYFLISTVTI